MKIGIWNHCDFDSCDLVLRLVWRFGAVILCAVDRDGKRLDGGSILGLNSTSGTIGLSKECKVPGLKTDHHGSVVVYAETALGIHPLNPEGDDDD
jgi:hypothetical protein